MIVIPEDDESSNNNDNKDNIVNSNNNSYNKTVNILVKNFCLPIFLSRGMLAFGEMKPLIFLKLCILNI